jgi:transmembrane sensor
MDRNDDGRKSLTEEAQRWYDILLRDPSETERADFGEWIRGSTRHVLAFLKLVALERELPTLNPTARQIDLRSLIAQVQEEQRSAMRPARRAASQRGWRRAVAVTTLVIALVITIAFFGLQPASGSLTYATIIGERRALPLPDGSTLELNTATRVTVRFTASMREVTLLAGEALFHVAHDPLRPFLVKVGPVAIQDVGTAFSVRTDPERIVVSVLSGQVDMRASVPMTQVTNERPTGGTLLHTLRLANGYAATFSNGLTPEKESMPVQISSQSAQQIERLTAWTRGRLIIAPGETLAELVRELNRYHQRKIVLDDPSLAGLVVGGAIDMTREDDIGFLVHTLSDTVEIELNQSRPNVVHLRRHSRPEP